MAYTITKAKVTENSKSVITESVTEDKSTAFAMYQSFCSEYKTAVCGLIKPSKRLTAFSADNETFIVTLTSTQNDLIDVMGNC